MTWHPSILAALEREAGTLIAIRLTTARGVALLSDGPASLTGPGLQVYPYVSRWGQIVYACSGASGALEAPTFDFDFLDNSEEIAAAVGELSGAACDVLLHTSQTAWANAAMLFSGVVLSAPSAGGAVTVRARVRDEGLQVGIPRAEINRYTAPNLPDNSGATAKAQPFIIGEHSSRQFTGDSGMLPAPLWDRVLHRYLLGVGVVLPDAVYASGVRKVEGTDWTRVVAIGRDLRVATFIQFVDDQGDSEITWDGTGLRDDGTTSGTLVDEPSQALALFLNNCAFYDWRRGAYLTGAPLSAAHFERLGHYLEALGHRASYYADAERRTGAVSVAQFTQTFAVRAFWTADGLLAVAPLDHRIQGDAVYCGPGAPDPTTRAALTVWADVLDAEPESSYDTGGTTQRVRVLLGHSAQTGRYHHERVIWPRSPGSSPSIGEIQIEGEWSPAAAFTGEQVTDLQVDATPTADYLPNGADTVAECIQAADDDKFARTANAAAGASFLRASFFACPDFVTIRRVELAVRARAEDGFPGGSANDELQLGLAYLGSDYPSGGAWSAANAQVVNVPGPWQEYRYAWANPPHAPSTPWTDALVDAYLGVVRYRPLGDRIDVDRVILRVYGVQTAAAFAPTALDIGSRHVHRWGVPFEQLRAANLPLAYASPELLEQVSVAWPRRGWNDTWWTREPFVVAARTLNLDTRTVDLTLEPLRAYLTTFRLDARATVDVLPDSIPLGIVLITAGAGFALAGGPTTVEGPAAEDPEYGPLVVTVPGSWPSGRRGLACHGARSNLLPDPCFQRGVLGWTLTPGANGATITADPALDLQLYGETANAGNVLSFVAGSPHSTPSTAVSTATTILSAGSPAAVQVWSRDFGAGPGDALAWRLRRAIDNWWWNEAARAWQVATVDNPLPFALYWSRFASRRINVGASPTALTLTIVQPAGGTPGRRSIVGHAQIEGAACAGPPIPSAATPGASAARRLSFDNDCQCGDRIYTTRPPERFTWNARVRPWWHGEDLDPGAVMTVFSVAYDGANAWSLCYVAGGGWRVRARSGGVNYDVTAEGPAGAPEALADIGLDVTATSGEGELGAPFVLMLRVTDSAGSRSATGAYVPPIEAPDALFYLGSSATGEEFDGDIITIVNSPFPQDLR